MEKQIKIALAGNPNSGKTTLFNALTGSNQFVGNWPGVTVEKKEGRLKKHEDVVIMDLPGIYSLSPYTLEEVVARNYLIGQRPDAILNIIDGTNLERNLYLTTQLTELGIPVVVAINMMDVVRKNGDQINVAELSRELGCKVVEISALKGDGVMEAAQAAVEAAATAKTVPMHTFSGPVEHAIAHIEEAAVHELPEEQQRWYAIKIFERDDKVLEQLKIDPTVMTHIEADIKAAEKELDDDAESIITNERYVYIAQLINIDLVAVLADNVHHVDGDDHGDTQLGQLGGQVQVPLQVGAVDDVQDGIRPLLDQVVPGHHFLHGVRRQGINAGQVGDGHIGMLFQLTFLFLHRNAGPVAHELVGTGEGIEQGGFAAVWVARKGNSDIHDTLLLLAMANT